MDNVIKGDTELLDLQKNQAKGWLQRLKEESWEAELLVSAIAIFGTFQLFGAVDWAANKLIVILNPSQYLIGYSIVFIGLLAISILTSMFVIHFFLRAYWIGLVGLNSVFPDYSIKDSAYSKIYTEKMLSILPKLEDSIKKVDELCSVIFSAAFTFLLIYAYFAFLASTYLVLFNLLSSYASLYILLIPVAFFILVLIVQMGITLVANFKGNKEKENLQILNFRIVKFSSKLTYGPLYRSIMQVSMIFGSNFKKKKSLVYLMIAFLFSGILLAVFQLNKTNIPYLITTGLGIEANSTRLDPNFYTTENTKNTFLLTPEIQSDIIKSGVLKVFIPIFDNEKKMREKTCGTYAQDDYKSKAEQRRERRLSQINCYRKYNTIFINDEKVAVDYLIYTHPRTDQFGIIGYVPISNAMDGMNNITIKKEFDVSNIKEWSIPFYNVHSN